MYYSHHFAHRHTLDRACSWLARLGFRADRIERHEDGQPRIALAVEGGRMAEVAMLINAVEHSDPEGWPSFWETAKQPPSHSLNHSGLDAGSEIPPVSASSASTRLPIGWHPIDVASEGFPNLM